MNGFWVAGNPTCNCLQKAHIWGSASVRGCICIWPMKSLYKALQLELRLASFRQLVSKASTVPSTNCKLLCGISAHGAWSPQWTQSLGQRKRIDTIKAIFLDLGHFRQRILRCEWYCSLWCMKSHISLKTSWKELSRSLGGLAGPVMWCKLQEHISNGPGATGNARE